MPPSLAHLVGRSRSFLRRTRVSWLFCIRLASHTKPRTFSSFLLQGFGEVLKMQSAGGKEKGVKKVLDTLRGQYVIARDERDGLYYPGELAASVWAERPPKFAFLRLQATW